MRKTNFKSRLSRNTEKLVTSARAPLIDKISELTKEVGKLKRILLRLFADKYAAEFEVIDGLNQHPAGLKFDEWLINEEWETER